MSNIGPTEKAKKVLYKMVKEGKPMGKAMVEAGFSPGYNSTILKHTKGWQLLLTKYVDDKKLLKVLDEGLDAGSRIFKNNNATKQIEEVGYEPDYAVRHKYLETGLKLKNRFPKETPTTAIQVNIGQDREEFK